MVGRKHQPIKVNAKKMAAGRSSECFEVRCVCV